MGLHERRTCSGCGAIRKVAGTRGTRGAKKPFCAECLSAYDSAQPTPIELLSKALPHVPAELAEQIAAVLPATPVEPLHQQVCSVH